MLVGGTGKDKISFNLGETGGLANKAAMRGAGHTFQMATEAGALDTDLGLLHYNLDVTDAAKAESLAELMTGEIANDVFFMITSTDVSAASATNTVYRVDVEGANDFTLTALATFIGQNNAITIANSGTITTAVG